jgi:signal transduction histidine kinase
MLKRICEVSNLILRCASGDFKRLDFIRGIAAIFDEYSRSKSVAIYLGDHQKSNVFEYYPPDKFTVKKLKRIEFPFNFFNEKDLLVTEYIEEYASWMDNFFRQFELKNGKKKAAINLSRRETEDGICFFNNNIDLQKGSSDNAGNYSSFCLIPFLIDSNYFAILTMRASKEKAFDTAQVNFFSKLIHVLSEGFAHQFAQDALKERVKELYCLYQITQIANKPNLSINQVLQQIADILPSAMQYPEIAYARIFVDDEYYKSSGFRESKIKLSSKISSKYEQRGLLEVFYRERDIPSYGQVFLQEEENLLETVSKQIALIIERKQVEELNTKLQEQLRHADRLATIGQLSAGIAHEINEPLATILGFAQLIEKSDNIPQESVDDAKKIINATLHSREIVRKLMLFSRQMPPKKGKINLNQIIDEGLYFLESRCQKSGVEIIKALESDMPEIDADPNQIHQILVNLIVNAIHAMPEGGKLILSTKDNKDNTVSFSVEDTGVGIKEEIREKIFIPFYTTKDINQGTGLGLSVVHGIVSSHSGQINVNSQLGKGSIFEIRLPVYGQIRE